MYTKERNNFIQALNEYFGYEVAYLDQFEKDFTEEFKTSEKQANSLMEFLFWYERKLNR
jgi:hypothetical protein